MPGKEARKVTKMKIEFTMPAGGREWELVNSCLVGGGYGGS